MKAFINTLKKTFILSVVLLVLCGFVYPLALTGVSQLLFKEKANGSLIKVDGKAVGSKLVGQQFSDARLFKCRISSVNYNTYSEEDLVADENGNKGYNGACSGNFNYATTNKELSKRVKRDLEAFMIANPDIKQNDIPTDLLTASGSGLDPHISVEAANVQVKAIAKATGLSEKTLQDIIKKNTESKVIGVFGENKVNVLKANIDVLNEIK